MAEPSHHTVAIQQVHNILLGARLRGLDVALILARAGIALALLESPLARVSQQQYASLIRVLRRQLRDELWGLADRPLRPGSFGLAMQQLVRCATLGEALLQELARRLDATTRQHGRVQQPDLHQHGLLVPVDVFVRELAAPEGDAPDQRDR